jgi:hypothetical protein
MRVFYDRLVDSKDQEWFLGFLKTTLPAFSLDFDRLFRHLSGGDGVTTEHLRSCFFTDIMDQGERAAAAGAVAGNRVHRSEHVQPALGVVMPDTWHRKTN